MDEKRKPSLKRGLEEMQANAPAKARRCEETTAGVQARERFANGQLPDNQVPEAGMRLPFPNIAAFSAYIDDEESDTSSDAVSDLDEDESVVKPLQNVQYFSRTASVVTLSSASAMMGGAVLAGDTLTMQRRAMLQRSSIMSASAPALDGLNRFASKARKPPPKPAGPDEKAVKPDDFVRLKLEKEGIAVTTVPSKDVADFFLPVTEATVEGYDMDLVRKVREEDVAGLRQLLKSGRNLQCSNKFGESIVHMACRRGSLAVLEFLFNEAGVDCKVCCDSGRTPLHDACWTSTPNFGVVRLLLARCPDLLYITDKRGFTPLCYSRHSHWNDWCDFLDKYSPGKLAAQRLWDDKK